MKFLSVLFLSFVGYINQVSAQASFPLDPETKKITYTEVVTVGSVKKAELLKRAQNWATTAKYAPSNRPVAGEYTCKGTINVTYPSIAPGKTDKGTVTFVATIYGKDGKYKYVITNFTHQDVLGRGDGGKLENETPECGKFIMSTTSWNKIKAQTLTEMEKIVARLKGEINKKPAPPKKKPSDF
ncbi:MAG: DUF4468 domain-containing protein [Bacteroidota bacterium]